MLNQKNWLIKELDAAPALPPSHLPCEYGCADSIGLFSDGERPIALCWDHALRHQPETGKMVSTLAKWGLIENDEALLAHGALHSIRRLLDDGGIPRGTFADDQVRNLVALYNRRGDVIEALRRLLDKEGFMGYDASEKFIAEIIKETVS